MPADRIIEWKHLLLIHYHGTFKHFEHIVKSWLAVCVNNTECFISIGNRMIFSDI